MRWQIKMLLIVACAFVGLGLAGGQAPFQPSGLGTVSKSAMDPVGLLHHPSVKKDLRLNEAQLREVDQALWKLLEKVLDSGQYKRLKEIDLQQREYRALADPDVQKELNFTTKQHNDMQDILREADKELTVLAEAYKKGIIPDLKDLKNRYDSHQTTFRDRCEGVLDEEQMKAWLGMLGDPFIWPKDVRDFPLPSKKDADTGKKGKKGG